jgi:hypothetical protein
MTRNGLCCTSDVEENLRRAGDADHADDHAHDEGEHLDERFETWTFRQ